MQILKVGSLLSVLLILLSGCESISRRIPDNALPSSISLSPGKPEQTQNDGVPHHVDITGEESLSVSFSPKETLPELSITFDLVGEVSGKFYSDYYYLCSVGQNDEVIQAFRIHSYEVLQIKHVHFIDIDFDGFGDMEIRWVSGSTNWPHSYFRFNPETSTFDETVFFSTNSRGVEFLSDTKQAIVTIQDGFISCSREMLQYADGTYSHARTEYTNWDHETETYTLSIWEHVDDGEWTEIYSATLTEDEYYGDLAVRDNYLRFGASAP